mmetsp:Transcript_1792/g.2376  ORF Transcript_1792/g.2376 Transcript_1792/m.2376 type:complete len:109 (+) Transcript_1792:3-329(+)
MVKKATAAGKSSASKRASTRVTAISKSHPTPNETTQKFQRESHLARLESDNYWEEQADDEEFEDTSDEDKKNCQKAPTAEAARRQLEKGQMGGPLEKVAHSKLGTGPL